MMKLAGVAAAGALLCLMPLAANAQDASIPGGRAPTTSLTVGGPSTTANWAVQADEWSPPKEGRIAEDWVYGNRFDNPDHVIWNPAKIRMNEGQDLVSFTQSSFDVEQYCMRANSGWDFSWVETQHRPIDAWQVDAMYHCGDVPMDTFAHGVRIPMTDERWIQMVLDAGAMVLVVPTVDSKEEAEEVVHWALFPPLGARSNGGGTYSSLYGNVPGGYRNSFNDNVVIIVMIETLWGVEDAAEIASVPGIDGVFAASGDLGNFSGYNAGDEAYEWLVERVNQAADAADVRLCGPLSWHYARNEGTVRGEQHFTCFQGGSNAANDLRERAPATP